MHCNDLISKKSALPSLLPLALHTNIQCSVSNTHCVSCAGYISIYISSFTI